MKHKIIQTSKYIKRKIEMIRINLFTHMIEEGNDSSNINETDLISYLSNRGIENAENAFHAFVSDTEYGKEQMYQIVVDDNKKSNVLQVVADIAIKANKRMAVNIWNDTPSLSDVPVYDITEHSSDEIFSFDGTDGKNSVYYSSAAGTDLDWSPSD